MKVEMGQKNTG